MASAQTEPSMDEILASIRRIISEEDDGAQDVPVRQKLETLHLADEAPAREAVRDQAGGGEPAAQLREVAREESQPEEAEPEAEGRQDAEADAQEAEKSEAEALDDFEPLPEETPSAGSTMEPAAAAHDRGETHDDTFDETPDAVAEAGDEQQEDDEMGSQTAAQDEGDAPKLNGAGHDLAEAVRPAVAAAARQQMAVNAASARQAADAFGALEENVRISSGSGRTIEDLVEQMLAPMLTAWLDENLPRIVEDKVEEEVRRIARRR